MGGQTAPNFIRMSTAKRSKIEPTRILKKHAISGSKSTYKTRYCKRILAWKSRRQIQRFALKIHHWNGWYHAKKVKKNEQDNNNNFGQSWTKSKSFALQDNFSSKRISSLKFFHGTSWLYPIITRYQGDNIYRYRLFLFIKTEHIVWNRSIYASVQNLAPASFPLPTWVLSYT